MSHEISITYETIEQACEWVKDFFEDRGYFSSLSENRGTFADFRMKEVSDTYRADNGKLAFAIEDYDGRKIEIYEGMTVYFRWMRSLVATENNSVVLAFLV